MTSTLERIRRYRGPAVFSYGFRPFFLGGAAWAALAIGLWLPMLAGRLHVPTALSPIDWHMHELVYGYVPAVVAGFLLTAVPNWTGRLPVTGAPLALLFCLWVAGRVAILISAHIGLPVAAVIDVLFLATLAAVIAREIIAGSNHRNLKVLGGVGLLLAGNILFYAESMRLLRTDYGVRLGIAAAVLLIMLIGGRIIPSFTRNWLARRGHGRLPAPFDNYDVLNMAVGAIALAGWVVAPYSQATAAAALLAAVMHGWRLSRWAGERTLAEPLVTILHVAYAFVPLGFVLLAAAIIAPAVMLPSGAVHAWTAGAVGVMTLAVMTRASLGHTGRDLTASRPIQAIYLAAVIAAVARIGAGFGVMQTELLHLSATAWVLAFSGFLIVYGPLLLRSRTAA